MIYLAKGVVKTYRNWIICELDNEIIKYYRALLPKCLYVSGPREVAHITIVRNFENPDRFGWSKYNGEPIDVLYYSGIQTDKRNLYYWLNAQSDRIIEIRKELGLSAYIGLYETLHITVGNTKQ